MEDKRLVLMRSSTMKRQCSHKVVLVSKIHQQNLGNNLWHGSEAVKINLFQGLEESSRVEQG